MALLLLWPKSSSYKGMSDELGDKQSQTRVQQALWARARRHEQSTTKSNHVSLKAQLRLGGSVEWKIINKGKNDSLLCYGQKHKM